MDKWKHINTAPRDGTEILVYCETELNGWHRVLEGRIVIAAWLSQIGGEGWYTDSASEMEGYESTGDYVVHLRISPTKWMPLPAEPTED